MSDSEKIAIEVPLKNKHKVVARGFARPSAKITFADEMAQKCVGQWTGRVISLNEGDEKVLIEVYAGFVLNPPTECTAFLENLPNAPLKGKFFFSLAPVFESLEVELPEVVADTKSTQLFAVAHRVSPSGELLNVDIKNAAPFNIYAPLLHIAVQCKDDRPGRAPAGSFPVSPDVETGEMPIGGELNINTGNIKKSLRTYLASLPQDSGLRSCEKPLVVTVFSVTQSLNSNYLDTEMFSYDSEKTILTP